MILNITAQLLEGLPQTHLNFMQKRAELRFGRYCKAPRGLSGITSGEIILRQRLVKATKQRMVAPSEVEQPLVLVKNFLLMVLLRLNTPDAFAAFPYDKPYEIQLALMRHLYASIEDECVAIIESPTGTVSSV
jgi:hypothetical protein